MTFAELEPALASGAIIAALRAPVAASPSGSISALLDLPLLRQIYKREEGRVRDMKRGRE
jgi:hypothetical protein